MKSFITILIIATLGLYQNLAIADELQSWSAVAFQPLKQPQWSLTVSAEARARNRPLGLFQLFSGLVVGYRANDHLHVGIGVRYIYSENQNRPANYLGRIEAQATPRVRLTDQLILQVRNQFETIAGFGSSPRMRFRQRLKANRMFHSSLLDSIFVSSEIFVEVVDEITDTSSSEKSLTINEIRIVPMGIALRISERIRFDVGYLIQKRFRNNGTAHVLALTLLSHW